MELPKFKYHPDPIGTGAIVETNDECECCGLSKGYKAESTIYAIDDIETICPWCISDGSAAKKFDGEFSDSYPLLEDGVGEKIVKEVCERTPSFNSWQQERWLSHCKDACEFHGDAQKSDLESLEGEQLEGFLKEEYMTKDLWPSFVQSYVPGNNHAVYKFTCRHCGQNKFYTDCD